MTFWEKLSKEYQTFKYHLRHHTKSSAAVEDLEPNKDESNFKFFMSIVANSFGIMQIWRVPQLAYESKGGAFLILYTFFLLTIGNATLYMEVALGQYISRTAMTVFRLVPIAHGIGFSCLLYGLFLLAYESSFVAYSIYYLLDTFTNPLFWAVCRERPYYGGMVNITSSCTEISDCSGSCEYPSIFYWKHIVKENQSYGNFWGLIGTLALSLSISWIIIYSKMTFYSRIESRFKWAIFLFPYLFFIPLLYESLHHKSSFIGMSHLLVPTLQDFLDIRTWARAVEQSLLSLGLGSSLAITLGSRSRFGTPNQIDCSLMTFLTLFASFVCSAVVFTHIAIVSQDTGIPFYETVETGPGMLFIILSESIKLLPYRTFLTLLFFFFLSTISANSCATLGNSLVHMICEHYPRFSKRWAGLTLVVLAFSTACPIMSKVGWDYSRMVNDFAIGYTAPFIIFLEALVVGFYGYKRFFDDIGFMLKVSYPSAYYRFLWMGTGVVPLAASTIGLATHEWRTWPTWASALGFSAFILILFPTFFHFGYTLSNYKRFMRLTRCFGPDPNYGPENKFARDERHDYKHEFDVITQKDRQSQ